jgi:hypothetical protein
VVYVSRALGGVTERLAIVAFVVNRVWVLLGVLLWRFGHGACPSALDFFGHGHVVIYVGRVCLVSLVNEATVQQVQPRIKMAVRYLTEISGGTLGNLSTHRPDLLAISARTIDSASLSHSLTDGGGLFGSRRAAMARIKMIPDRQLRSSDVRISPSSDMAASPERHERGLASPGRRVRVRLRRGARAIRQLAGRKSALVFPSLAVLGIARAVVMTFPTREHRSRDPYAQSGPIGSYSGSSTAITVHHPHAVQEGTAMATPREQLADALRQARSDAGYPSHRELSKVLKVSRPVVSRAENPREPVPRDDLIGAWADATGADKAKLLEYAQRARNPRNWFAVWADDFEQRATLLREFAPLLVNGLFQTEAYARATFAWKPLSADAETNLTERLARQPLLGRAELRVLILGSVLHREVGSASVMYEQMQHLLSMGEHPNVMLGIVPDTPAIAGALGGSFSIATEDNLDVAVYTDSIIHGGVYTEAGLITRAVRMFDGLRADALPWTQTREQLVQAGESWKQRTD